MNTEPKSYDCRAAFVAIAMKALAGEVAIDDVKLALLDVTDIPNDRIDFAASELIQAVGPIRNMLALQKLTYGGRDLTEQEIADTIPGGRWVDDTKGEMRVAVRVLDDDGEEVASCNSKTKLD